MEIRLHDDPAEFAELTAPLFNADPVRHTIAVTVLATRLRPDGRANLATLLTLHDGDALRGAVLRAHGWSLITSGMPAEAAPAVAEALQSTHAPPPGVNGPVEPAEAFAAAWCERTGGTAKLEMAQRLFALGELRPPTGVPGASRVADPGDIELLARWRQDFTVAAIPASWGQPEDLRAAIAEQISTGHGYLLWEVNGEPVSWAAASAPAAGMSRLGPVWTPPEHRGHGFGSAVTAAASQWALDAGAHHVVLFTDLANPVSNSIYPKVGYRPVLDAVDLAFE